MTRAELLALHAVATETRDSAHRAYEIALRNITEPGDTQAAYDTLLLANKVRDKIYQAVLALAVRGQ